MMLGLENKSFKELKNQKPGLEVSCKSSWLEKAGMPHEIVLSSQI